jgi:uridylate kinase
MKIIVLSLGGSLIVPDKIDYEFLENFKSTIKSNYKNYKFVVVCGGGSIARKYIEALRKEKKDEKTLSLAGIRATRMNALFLMQLFGKEANDNLPLDMIEVKNYLKKNKIVFCGALRYASDETSDGTAAKLANFLGTDFVNLTNINGLYTDNPLTNKNAKFVPKITWKDFEKMALKIPFKAGQHFVLDQQAAVIIRKHKIKTYILGKNMKNFNNLLKNKKFIGTTIFQ